MSPLTRSLLALACAALLRASSADVMDCFREEVSDSEHDVNPDLLPVDRLQMGLVDAADKHLRVIRLIPNIVPPMKSTTVFIFDVPNHATKNEALVGQDLVAFDLTLKATKISLTPVKKGHHSPLKAVCTPSCPKGIKIIAEQFAIKKLD